MLHNILLFLFGGLSIMALSMLLTLNPQNIIGFIGWLVMTAGFFLLNMSSIIDKKIYVLSKTNTVEKWWFSWIYCRFYFGNTCILDQSKNEFGIKDKNDWIGHKLDAGIDAVEKSAEKTVDGVENVMVKLQKVFLII